MAMIFALPVTATAQQPLSASDWLSGSVAAPPREASAWRPGAPVPPGVKRPRERPQPVAESGAIGPVQVSRLGAGNPDASGTLSAHRAGLPLDLWRGSDAETVARRLADTPARLPAMNALLQRVLRAQLHPPDATPGTRPGQVFLARADRLLDIGALEPAEALLLTAGPGNPDVFRRLFDIALLQGDEARACEIMGNTPGIAPSFAARIFCLAQSGDWAAAAISLRGAETLGLVDQRQAVLLTHFLDDAFVDNGDLLEPAARITPLEFRIHEAIGQPLPTQPLPIAFAHSDMRPNAGWKARLDAAERLARAGALPAPVLRATYGEQSPAASGGVWERAGAMRTLEAALATGDVSGALPRAFDEFRAADMAPVLAAMVAEDLPRNTAGPAAEITAWLRQWQGLPVPAPIATDDALRADTPAAPGAQRGEALLDAMTDIDAGVDGDLARAARGLAMLRTLGLPEDADLAASQLTLMPMMRPAP